MSVLTIDFETRSAADLRKTGAHRYFEDLTADALCAAYAIDDGPARSWRYGEPCPDDLRDWIEGGGAVAAWNAAFEYWCFKLVMGPKHGWPVPRIDQMRDTMAQAAACSIPQSLAGAAQALGLGEQKDKDGGRLIRKFCVPRKARKGEVPGRLYWNDPKDHRDDFDALVRYCVQDVEVERAARDRLMPLSDYEQKVWEFTMKINDRGVRFDLSLVSALVEIVTVAKAKLDKRMAQATNYEITACSQVSALTAWLRMQGVDAEKLNKNAIEDLLASDLPDHAREAVELRREAAKTSTAKLEAIGKTVAKDGRVHGLHAYHAAGTGRWGGRLVQTQNMPRGTGTVKDPEGAAEDFMRRSDEWIDLVYGRPMYAVSDMLRSTICASPGCRLLAADYSSIEGRVTAWVAGEHDELDAYRAVDDGTGPGIYEIAAGGIFNVDPYIVTKDQRQVGKAASLALGFGGGVLAFHSMAGIYGIDMAPVYPTLCSATDPEIVERAVARYEECLERGDTGTDLMSREAWIASEITKVLWRQRHPYTVQLWSELEAAAHSAVQKPGHVVSYGKIAYLVARGFLWCRLPSGRCLAYGNPQIQDRKTPWGDTKAVVTALGVNSVTKKWERFALYGGLATENVVQGIARDLMAAGMLKAEDAGYPIIMTVHDEAVADVPNGYGTLAEFERLLCDLPGWAEGIPLVASGWGGHRYRKD